MFINSSELLFLIPLAAAALVLIARLDIYFSIRRHRIADDRYLAEMSRTRFLRLGPAGRRDAPPILIGKVSDWL